MKSKFKSLLIIYPHWPPSNLAGVHRPRLISNYLPEFNWHPIVLTVYPKYYEEKPDWDLLKTVSPATEIVHVNAFRITSPRIIGDIGLRGFWQIYRGAKKVIKERKVDFIWIPIPSFYVALMGRLLYRKFKVPYGIDYIDPWVRDISGRNDWRHRMSNWLAKLLEPIAIKKATLITGVSKEYYKPALLRNFKKESIFPVFDHQQMVPSRGEPYKRLDRKSANEKINKSKNKKIHHLAFPYGFDPNDHLIKLEGLEYPWDGIEDCLPIVYAGAFLPNSRLFIEVLFQAIGVLMKAGKWNNHIHLFFLGTGSYQGKTILEYAKEKGIEKYVHEHRDRYPFLHILNYLSLAFGILVIGSTEKHYTASKVFQSVLSGKPVFAILHQDSTARKVLQKVQADVFTVEWNEQISVNELNRTVELTLSNFINISKGWQPNTFILEKEFSSRILAEKLTSKLEEIFREGFGTK